MPNVLDKDRNKVKDKDEIRTTQEVLILAQQAEHRQKLQQLTDGHRRGKGAQMKGVHSPSRLKSAEELPEETW